MEGWLTKRGRNFGGWQVSRFVPCSARSVTESISFQKRYYVLAHGALSYYDAVRRAAVFKSLIADTGVSSSGAEASLGRSTSRTPRLAGSPLKTPSPGMTPTFTPSSSARARRMTKSKKPTTSSAPRTTKSATAGSSPSPAFRAPKVLSDRLVAPALTESEFQLAILLSTVCCRRIDASALSVPSRRIFPKIGRAHV